MPVSTHRDSSLRFDAQEKENWPIHALVYRTLADPLDFIQALYASRVVIFKPSSRFIDTCENGGGVR